MVSNNRCVLGFNLSFLFDEYAYLTTLFSRIMSLLEDGKIRPLPVTVYTMSNVAQAHIDIESGKTLGKLVITTPFFQKG